jgi:hypothetical protein
MKFQPVIKTERYAYLDTLRSALFSLGLVLHAAWLCKHLNVNFKLVHDVIHGFRMEAFFWIAGFLSARSLCTRSAGKFLGARLQRLGIPLAFCFVLFSLLDRVVGPDGWSDVSHSSAVAGVPMLELTSHLWFLRTLLCFAITLAVLHHFRWSRRGLEDLRHFRFSPAFFICLVTIANYVAVHFTRTLPPGAWQWPHLVSDVDNFVRYGVWFATGYYLFLNLGMMDVVSGWLVFNLANAFGFPFASLWLENSVVGHFAVQVWQGAWLVSVCTLLIKWSKRLFRDGETPLNLFADAGYTIYLLSWPLMALIYEFVTPMRWPPIAIFVWLIFTSGLVSYLAHRFVVLKFSLMAWLLNGVPFGTGKVCVASPIVEVPAPEGLPSCETASAPPAAQPGVLTSG